MQGVSEASERPGFFKRIMEANVSGIAKAYAAAERLFGQLQVWQLLMVALHTPGPCSSAWNDTACNAQGSSSVHVLLQSQADHCVPTVFVVPVLFILLVPAGCAP